MKLLSTFKLKEDYYHNHHYHKNKHPADAIAGDSGVICRSDHGSRTTTYLLLVHHGKPSKADSDRHRYLNDLHEIERVVEITGQLSPEEAIAHPEEEVQLSGKYVVLKQMVAANRPFVFKLTSSTRSNPETDLWTVKAFRAKYIEIVKVNHKDAEQYNHSIEVRNINWSSVHELDVTEAATSFDRVTRNRIGNPLQNILDEVAEANERKIRSAFDTLRYTPGQLHSLQDITSITKLPKKHREAVKKQIESIVERYHIKELQTQASALAQVWIKFSDEITQAIKSTPV